MKNNLNTRKSLTAFMMLITLILVSASVNAQTVTPTQDELNTKIKANTPQAKALSASEQKSVEVKQEAPANDPNAVYAFYRYKGIADISLAKEAWIKDNPDAYGDLSKQLKKSAPQKQ